MEEQNTKAFSVRSLKAYARKINNQTPHSPSTPTLLYLEQTQIYNVRRQSSDSTIPETQDNETFLGLDLFVSPRSLLVSFLLTSGRAAATGAAAPPFDGTC
jgi:hypothetical protein